MEYLNNFVINSTDKVLIKSNIDWNKNGNYEIVFTLNDLEVTKNVTLNIAANTIVDLEKEIFDLIGKLKHNEKAFETFVNKLKKEESKDKSSEIKKTESRINTLIKIASKL